METTIIILEMYFLQCLDIIIITFLLCYGIDRCQTETDRLACFLSLQMSYVKSVMLALESSFGSHALVTKSLAVCTTDA